MKPVVKWAGGKRQLLDIISNYYPKRLGIDIKKYAELFVGGGAVLFDILKKYEIDEVYISDINRELINVYNIIRDDVNNLIKKLKIYEKKFINLNDSERRNMFYKLRDDYNEIISSEYIERKTKCATLFLFLNKTCFNGLYRVNSNGLYNVPFGSYKNPCICDEINILEISKLLKKVNIHCRDFRESYDFIDSKTFVYCDPPYRPLSNTANFTSYSGFGFDDNDQIALAEYVQKLSIKGAYVLVSNSDPKNSDINDNFFNKIYVNQKIDRVKAKRVINSASEKRGSVSELLIYNYKR